MDEAKVIESRKLSYESGEGFQSQVSIDYSHRSLHIGTIVHANSIFSSEESLAIDSLLVDPNFLPFRDASFRVVFCFHFIEQALNPGLVLGEMSRVAERKIVIRYFKEKQGLNESAGSFKSLDKEWLTRASENLGLENKQFVIACKNPVISKLQSIFPRKMQTKLFHRGLRRLGKTNLLKCFEVSSEIEAWFIKKRLFPGSDDVRFIVVYNIPETFKTCFAASPFVNREKVLAYNNAQGESLPVFFNKAIRQHMQENVWFVFCHQDFVLKEDLLTRLSGNDVGALYGPIGGRLASGTLTGLIVQNDGSTLGSKIENTTPVQTLDEMCLIVHSEIFRQGLRFDEAFCFHFYAADLCMQAYISGFDILAMPLSCEHKSRTIHGDIFSSQYISSLSIFREKWRQFLPVRTTTKLITCAKSEE